MRLYLGPPSLFIIHTHADTHTDQQQKRGVAIRMQTHSIEKNMRVGGGGKWETFGTLG